MFGEVSFQGIWEGVQTILPTLQDVMAIAAGFWAAGLLLVQIRRFMGINKSNQEEKED